MKILRKSKYIDIDNKLELLLNGIRNKNNSFIKTVVQEFIIDERDRGLICVTTTDSNVYYFSLNRVSEIINITRNPFIQILDILNNVIYLGSTDFKYLNTVHCTNGKYFKYYQYTK